MGQPQCNVRGHVVLVWIKGQVLGQVVYPLALCDEAPTRGRKPRPVVALATSPNWPLFPKTTNSCKVAA